MLSQQLARARAATANYHDVAAAEADGVRHIPNAG
jgi:hypothetical protein